MKPPCKVNGVNCPDRTIEPNCHSTCEKYLAFVASRENARAEKDAVYHQTYMNEAKDKAYRKKLNQYKRYH